ncbi:MAG: hypothetical protein WAW37_04220 [Syntrophobacteraceae bacterium]
MVVPDKRMLWIRNLDALGSAESSYVVEAELGSELQIPGLLTYADGAVLLGPATFEADSNRLFKYVLRLRLPRSADGSVSTEELVRKGTREGYLFQDGPIGELVALFSLRLQARLFILSTSMRYMTAHDLPLKTEYAPLRGRIGPHLDGVVFSRGDRNLYTSLLIFLDDIRAIPPKYHLEVVVAANHYTRALREIGVDEEMVLVRLVSAIETAAMKQAIPDDLLGDTNLEQLILTGELTDDQVEELRRVLKTRRTKSRFIAFIEEYSTGFFDAEPREPAHTQVTPENLASVAGAVYDARSGYLHNGDPMYLSRPVLEFPAWHMDPSVGMVWQDRSFNAKQKLPRADFFHRLVRHCLLSRLSKLIREETG